MANTKISALSSATTPLSGSEIVPINQSGVTDSVSVANLTAGRAVSAASLSLTSTPLAVGSGGTGIGTGIIGFKNRLINAGFIINQRGYSSGTSLSSGTYGHDRWKGGGSGGTYTYTQGNAGVPIAITITAGTIQQVIEGSNLPEGGTYTLSWTGTATARINSGSYTSSPITVTGQTAGSNMTIEFGTGTVQYPQLETGSYASNYDYRAYGQEILLCQRYCYQLGGSANYEAFGIAYVQSSTSGNLVVNLPVKMRSSPTVSYVNLSNLALSYYNGSNYSLTSLSVNQTSTQVANLSYAVSSSPFLLGQIGLVVANGTTNVSLLLTAEL